MVLSRIAIAAVLVLFWLGTASAGTKTWDGKHDTRRIEVTAVYFVPSDRQPLPDWRDRMSYFCRRIEQFHLREFGTQSRMQATIHEEPLISELTTRELRVGDGDAIYYRTLSEVDRRLEFARQKGEAFPILLVFSDINWRPLDDFYRLHPTEDGTLEFEGNYSNQEHFPGAASGGARAAYFADRGVGWGLVSADGWRVPYRGSDCVVYHEGCGHTVGLPHPEPGNGSVMSLGQYMGWISESWLDKEQKSKLQWEPEDLESDLQMQLFSTFRAIPEPLVPKPNESSGLKLDWPQDVNVKSLRVRFQTSINSPWIDVPQELVDGEVPDRATLGSFDRETPISYRVDAELRDGETAELWGYFQVRDSSDRNPAPNDRLADLNRNAGGGSTFSVPDRLPPKQIDVLQQLKMPQQWSSGEWSLRDGVLESPKQYGARLELMPPSSDAYRMIAIVEPLDEPNGLIFGHRLGSQRFLTLVNYANGDQASSAIENVSGRNVGNETTFRGNLLKKNQLSQVVINVRKSSIELLVDGRLIIDWTGDPKTLSLGDYWSTPNERSLFVGAYDCRYRFHRLTLEPLNQR
ncbi:MAG: hypothetical protein R3C05_01450 [Pirellulaceae bacterium]